MNKTLNRLLTIAIFALLLLQFARLIQPLLPETAPPAAKQYPRETIDWHTPKLTSNLWKISRPGQPDSYLLGTIHVGPAQAEMNPAITRLVSANSKIITEIPENISPKENETIAYVMQSKTPLRQKIGASRYNALEERIRKLPGGSSLADGLDRLHPWAVFLAILPLDSNLNRETGVETFIYREANRQGKPQDALETPSGAVMYFALINDSLATAALEDWARRTDRKTEQEEHELLQAYQNGNFEQIPVLLEESTAYDNLSLMTAEQQQALGTWLKQDLIVARNRNWLPKIKQESARQRTLFAVGSMHLAGSNGLIALLRRDGYTVTPEPKLPVWQ